VGFERTFAGCCSFAPLLYRRLCLLILELIGEDQASFSTPTCAVKYFYGIFGYFNLIIICECGLVLIRFFC